MTKYYCDCCGEEIERRYKFNYLCHLDPSGKWRGHERNGQPVSGRDETKDLCLVCYNKILSKAINEFVRIATPPKGE